MKYGGTVELVLAVEEGLKATKCALFEKQSGNRGDYKGMGVGASDLFSIVYNFIDKGYIFRVTFEYEHRDNKAAFWLDDKDAGRFNKRYPTCFPLYGKLTPVTWSPEEVSAKENAYALKKSLTKPPHALKKPLTI